jgi:sulfatase modifying factor 1
MTAMSRSAVALTPGLNNIETEMRVVPAGPFMMGSDVGGEFEGPCHEVYLPDYMMDATLVTNRQFNRFADETGHVTESEKRGCAWGFDGHDYRSIAGLSWRSFVSGREDHPVVMVSWRDAATFAAWAGKRLPTEAEWEKAARGGRSGQLFPWGDQSPNGNQCPFGIPPAEVPPTVPVKAFAPNGFGLYDVVGNVWQWCCDWFGEDYYALSAYDSPTGPNHGSFRVRRGGAWNVVQSFRLRCSNRGAFDPNSCAPNIGFRCAAGPNAK